MCAVSIERRASDDKFVNFDPSEYAGNNLAFYNPASGEWESGFASVPPVVDKKKREITLTLDGRTAPVVIKDIPKKFQSVENKVFNLKGKKFIASSPLAHEGGVVEYDLQEIDNAGNVIANGEKIQNVSGDMLASTAKLSEAEVSVDAKIASITGVAGEKHKQLLDSLLKLKKDIVGIVKQYGAVEDWYGVSEAEISRLKEETDKLTEETATNLAELQSDLDKLNTLMPVDAATAQERADVAVGMSVRLEALKKADQEAVVAYTKALEEYNAKKKAHDDWVKKRDEYNDWQNNGANQQGRGQRGGNRPPPQPGLEPTDPDAAGQPGKPAEVKAKSDEQLANDLYIAIRAELQTAGIAQGTSFDLLQEVVRIVDDPKTMRIAGYPNQYPPAIRDMVTGKTMLEVIRKWQAKEFQEEVFDLDAEKNKLKEKIDSFKDKITQKQYRDLNVILKSLNTINPAAPALKPAILDLWKKLGEIEVEIFKKDLKPESSAVEAQELKIGIPSEVLMEIVKGRPGEMKVVMERAFGSMLNGESPEKGIGEALKTLFSDRPDEATMKELRKYGIKDWATFKKMWDEKLSEKVAVVMRKWAEEQLKAHVILNSSGWESFVTQAKKFGAIKGELAARVLITAACVGGGAMAATALLPAGITVLGVGVGAAAVGGGAGGLVRGIFNRLIFGGKEQKEEQAKKMQIAEARRIEELVAKKRKSLAKDIVGQMFRGEAETADEDAMTFASLLSEAMQESQKGEQEKFTVLDEKGTSQEIILSGNGQKMYERALKHLKLEGGLELDSAQRTELALAISKLEVNGDQKIREKIKSADPLVVRALDGFFKAYSGRLGEEEGALATVGGVGASTLVGAAVGTAFFSASTATRAAMGAAGMGLGGYRLAESSIKKDQEKTAVREVENLIVNIKEDYSESSKLADGDQMKDGLLDDVKFGVDKLKAALKGKGDMAWVAAIDHQPLLRAQVNNLISELTRKGLYGERKAFATWEQALNTIAVEEQVHTDRMGRAKGRETTGREKAKKLLYSAVGAAAGAALAVVAGEVIQFGREKIGLVSEAQGATRPHTREELPKPVAAAPQEVRPVAPTPTAEIRPPESHSPFDVKQIIAEKTAGVGGSAEKSINSLMRSAAVKEILHHPDGSPMTSAEKSAWMREELGHLQVQNVKGGKIVDKFVVGYQYGEGAVKHPLMLHPGAKFEVYQGGDGRPHLMVIGEEGKDFKVLDKYLVEKAGSKIKMPSLDEARTQATPKVEAPARVPIKSADEFAADRAKLAEAVKISDVGEDRLNEIYSEKVPTPQKGYTNDDLDLMRSIRAHLQSEIKHGMALQEGATPEVNKELATALFAKDQYSHLVASGDYDSLPELARSLGIEVPTHEVAPVAVPVSTDAGAAGAGETASSGGKSNWSQSNESVVRTPIETKPAAMGTVEKTPAVAQQAADSELQVEGEQINAAIHLNSLRDELLASGSVTDRDGVLSRLITKIQQDMAVNPKRIAYVESILDKQSISGTDKIQIIAEALQDKLYLTPEERLCLGGDFIKDTGRFESGAILNRNGMAISDARVVLPVGMVDNHAFRLVYNDGREVFVSDPDWSFFKGASGHMQAISDRTGEIIDYLLNPRRLGK